jgi:hypothetical protein
MLFAGACLAWKKTKQASRSKGRFGTRRLGKSRACKASDSGAIFWALRLVVPRGKRLAVSQRPPSGDRERVTKCPENEMSTYIGRGHIIDPRSYNNYHAIKRFLGGSGRNATKATETQQVPVWKDPLGGLAGPCGPPRYLGTQR